MNYSDLTTGEGQGDAILRRDPPMKKSWSTNSLSSSGNNSGAKSCVCSPTKHIGSFRCRLHRDSLNHHHHDHDHHLPAPPLSRHAQSSTGESVEAK